MEVYYKPKKMTKKEDVKSIKVEDLYEKLKKHNLTYHEMINGTLKEGRKLRAFIDFDGLYETLEEAENNRDIIIKKLKKKVKTDFYVLDATGYKQEKRKYTLSLHVIFMDRQFKRLLEVDDYVFSLFKEDDPINDLIDSQLYVKNIDAMKSLRMPYCLTDYNDRPLRLVNLNEPNFTTYDIKDISLETFNKLLITTSDDEYDFKDDKHKYHNNHLFDDDGDDDDLMITEPIDNKEKKQKKKTTKKQKNGVINHSSNLSKEEIDEVRTKIEDILEELAENDEVYGFNINWKSMKKENKIYIIPLRKVKGVSCLICERIHTSNNQYLTWNDKKDILRYKCQDEEADGEAIILYGEVKTVVKTEEIERDYKADNGYYFIDFKREILNGTLRTYDELLNLIIKKINKIMFISLSEKVYVFKQGGDETYIKEKKIPEYLSFKYKDDDDKIKFVSLEYLIKKQGLIEYIDDYINTIFKPYNIYESNYINNDYFNTWNGFKATLLNKNQIDKTKIQDILDILYYVWADQNEERYHYILSWFHKCFKYPNQKTRVCLTIYSQEQQIGKGLIFKRLLKPYIYGEAYARQICGLNDITGQYNGILQNKLLIQADEVSNTTGSFHSSFDKMKNLLTEDEIFINEKYGNQQTSSNFLNLMVFTNNEHSLKIDDKDQRYCILEAKKYFDTDTLTKIATKTNQEIGDHFYSYVYYLENPINNLQTHIPRTNLKKEMKIQSLSSSCKFLLYVKERLEDFKNDDDDDDDLNNFHYSDRLKGKDKIQANDFYKLYESFCMETGEFKTTMTKFGRDLTKYMTKKRFSKGWFYLLDTIKDI